MAIHVNDLAMSKAYQRTLAGQQCIRIVVADDMRLFRESIAEVLDAEPSFSVVGLAGNGLEAIELVRQLTPDILLLDVKMPQIDGITAIRQIKMERPETRMILLTTLSANGYVMEGLAAGANGYLLKDTSTAGLISAIRAVYAGEQVTAPGVTCQIMQLLDRQSADKGNRVQREDGLTPREMETLLLIARGMIAKEIAHTLAISEKTVRNHISSIYHKLNIYDRSQVVIYAMKKGLVNINDV